MKKYTLIAALILGSISIISAQYIRKYDYCQGNISPYLTSSGAQLDADDKIPYKLNTKKFIVNKQGKNIEFLSVADFINFMGKYGWEFVQFFPANSGDIKVNILFKRELIVTDQESKPDTKTQGGG